MSIQPPEQTSQNQGVEELQQTQIEAWDIRILHGPPPLGGNSRMVVGHGTAGPPQDPGEGEHEGNHIQISPGLGGLQAGTPHPPESGQNSRHNSTHRRQPLPQANQYQGIPDHVPRVSESYGDKMGSRQAAGDHPEDKPGGRLPVQSSSLRPPHQHPAAQQDRGRNQHPEGVQGDGTQSDGRSFEVGEHENPFRNGR